MIKGLGIDIVEICRIEEAVNRNKKFLNKIFSKDEIKYIETRNKNSATIAGLFSAKESVSKALGTGIRGFNWTDIEIGHDALGKPKVALSKGAKEIAIRSDIDEIFLSISHDKGKAISIAIAKEKAQKESEKKENVSNITDILIKRDKYSHKGTYGKIGIIAGSKGMAGSAFLSSSAALRTGSGLVYTMVPESISQIVEMKSVEAIVRSFKDDGKGFSKDSIKELVDDCESLDAIALGPGIGQGKERIALVNHLLSNLKMPVVLDADGINCIGGNKEILKAREHLTILTPHLGEFSRLIKKSIEEIKAHKEEYAREFSSKYGVVLVLKGHLTLVCDGENIYENTTGNPGMSTAGSGDVLTGIIASLLGQGISGYDAARLGVYLHGLAGDISAIDKGEYGLIASDIIESIPYAIKKQFYQ